MSASIIAADVFQEDAAKYLGTAKMGGIAAATGLCAQA
jgi:hypothetical protein